jgi:hypothetical protein
MPPDRWGKGRENSRFVLLLTRTAEANMYKKVCTSGETLMRDTNAVVREYLIQEREDFSVFLHVSRLPAPAA